MSVFTRDVIHGVSARGDRFMLRVPIEEDADQVAEACNDSAIGAFLTQLPQPYERSDALAWITRMVPANWTHGDANFVVVDEATGQLFGSVGLNNVRFGGRSGAVGYWSAPAARRRGITTAAVRALADWAYGQGTQRLELLTALPNEASQRVALGAGFRHEGLRRAYGQSAGPQLTDRAAWVRLDTDSGDPVPRVFPDLPLGGLSDGVVTLRRLGLADVDAKFALDLLPEVRENSVRPDPTYEDTLVRCELAAYDWLAGNRATFAILDAATGTFAGDIGAFHPDPTGQVMIGYSVGREWRGRGFATRAVRLVTDWAFDDAGFARVIAGTSPTNEASQRVLSKAGFAREGYEWGRLPGQTDASRIDNVAFAITRDH